MTSVSDEKWRPFNCFFQSGRGKDLSAPLYVQLLLALEILLQIKAATASGLRTRSQNAITTSKLPFVVVSPRVPPPFGFTELKLC